MQMPMPMPFPSGSPMRLPAQVAGSMSALQGHMMAAQPEIQNAYAMHWLAFRHAHGQPEFQQLTQNMLWGAYSTLAMQGLLRHALSGRATPEVMGGIIDQARIMQNSYRQATSALSQFLETPENRQIPMVPAMTRAFQPLDRVYQSAQAPMEAVTQGMAWTPSEPMGLVNLPKVLIPDQTSQVGEPDTAEQP